MTSLPTDATEVVQAGGKLDFCGTAIPIAKVLPMRASAEHDGDHAAPQSATAAPEPPRGVWIGTMADLDALELPEPVSIGSLGTVSIVAGEGTLIYGPPSVSKTMLAFHAALSAVLAGHVVMLVEGEGSRRATRDRLQRLARGLRYNGLGELGVNLHIMHGAFGLDDEQAMWRAQLERVKPAIVVIDPMVSYCRGDENSADEVSTFLRAIDIARAGGASVLLLHHGTKPDSEGRSRERGSSALRAWADVVVGLARGKDDAIILTHEKNRDGAKQEPQTLTWRFTDEVIDLVTSAAAPDAVVSASTSKRTTKLLGLLVETGGMKQGDLRTKMGVSGEVLKALLEPLLKDRRVVSTVEKRPDTRGRPQDTTVLRLASGQPDVSQRAEPADDDTTGALQ